MQDFKLGDTGSPHVFAKPGLLFEQFGGKRLAIGIGDPAVAFPQHADEVGAVVIVGSGGPAAGDLAKADGKDLAAFRLGRCDPPAEVHFHKLDKPVAAEPSQFGEDLLHQKVAFLEEVAEGGTDEDAHDALSPDARRCVVGHRVCSCRGGRRLGWFRLTGLLAFENPRRVMLAPRLQAGRGRGRWP